MIKNLTKYPFSVQRSERRSQKNHSSFVVWFTGLSGSGKSTIANATEKKLIESNINTYILDGDNVRHGLNNDLAFSPEERVENIRRIGEVCNLFVDAGIVVLASFISPYRENREDVKNVVGSDNFVEVYINTSLEECEKRDSKGLYEKARKGEINNFTGISAPYENPMSPDIEIKTEELSLDDAVTKIVTAITSKLSLE